MESCEKLASVIENRDWDTLVTILKPKDFCGDMPRTHTDFIKLLKVADLLVDKEYNLSDKIKCILLKCLANSCVNGYIDKVFDPSESEDISSNTNIYKFLSLEAPKWSEEGPYPFHINFPYDGVVRCVIQTIIEYTADEKRLTEDQFEVLRLSLQFLCNFITFAFGVSTSSNVDIVMEFIKEQDFGNTIMKLVGHDRPAIARAACAYIHNTFKRVSKEFYAAIEKIELTAQLIKSTIADTQAALDTITLLLKEPTYLKDIYDKISTDDKLYLLDIIYQEASSLVYNEANKAVTRLPIETIEFLSDKLKKKSDLILKTVDTHTNDLEPIEVTILLDILGVLTSNPDIEECKKLQEDKSLLINCIFLLKAVHMAGKESNNYFTPLQKLNDLSLTKKNNCCNEAEDPNNHVCSKKIESHPAFGFKAGLIRVIGNLVYKHEKNQNLVRETEGIPILLDCCNIDARNPLIIQWATLAIRNLLESNSENQEIIRKSVKVGVVDSAVIRELGLTLHDEGDGKAVGILPLPNKD